MKRVTLALLALALAAGAQTTTPPVTTPPAVTTSPTLPNQVFGALLFYNQGNVGSKINGSFFAAVPAPFSLPQGGTYIYNAVDILGVGRHQVMTVPTIGMAQHMAWLTPKVELFGLFSGGVSVASLPNGTGSNVTPAFGGGGGVNIGVGKNFYIPVLFKVLQAQGTNTLVGGLGIAWGR